jgi:acyl-CoA synthetase (AMP-forming)/AMP-acid ligase II
VACVVLHATATTDELIAFCREGLAHFKRPRHVLLFDELPTTATGKLQRFRIRELAVERLGGAAAPDLTSLTGGR